MKNLLFSLIFISLTVGAKDQLKNVKKFDWNGIEVVWVKDDTVPLYTISIYFGDGALSDSPSKLGETEAMFSLLNGGTRVYNQKEIADNIEFFGTSMGAEVTHEYSTYSVVGLVKDLEPTMKMVCHMFSEATFPAQEVKNYKKRLLSSLKNLVSDHASLSSHIFRQLSLSGTKYSTPVTGKMSTIKKFRSSNLSKKLSYFNSKVFKRIYITGPKSVLNVKKVINKDCNWKSTASYSRTKKAGFKQNDTVNKKFIYLVPVPEANQAQVRLGRFVSVAEVEKTDWSLANFSNGYLGGGFTSVLMRQLRGENGFAYSAGSYAGRQKDYGRVGVATSTKNESVNDLLNKIKEILNTTDAKKISDEEFNRVKAYLNGNYVFSFETSAAFLGRLQYYDHIGKPYKNIFDFPDKLKSYSKEDLVSSIKKLFNFNDYVIMVVGNKRLKAKLERIAPVRVLKYQKFL
jgi:zinc protease